MIHAFDMVYFIDILMMITYKALRWDDAKLYYKPRNGLLLIAELISIIPSCDTYYLLAETRHIYIYYCLRLRYNLRLVRFILYLRRKNSIVGYSKKSLLLQEILIFIMIGFLFISLALYGIHLRDPHFKIDFLSFVYNIFVEVTGKGVLIHQEDSNAGNVIKMIFLFVTLVGLVYYVSCFICAIMQENIEQFYQIEVIERVMLKIKEWKFYALNKTVRNIIFIKYK